jgi:Rha family phage regulatory protein
VRRENVNALGVSKMTNAIQAIVTIQNDQLTTTSKNIADVFGKQHRNVMQAIDNLLPDLPAEWGMLNFQQGYYTMPETAEQQHRMFTITRDGFTLLAMGFTGKKALEFKLAYIDQFNAMQKALTVPQIERLTLTPEQQRFVQKAVNAKVKKTGEHWNTIYHNIKDVFNVGTYTDIKQETFPALCEYLGVVYTGEFIAATEAPKASEQQPHDEEKTAALITRMIHNLVASQVKQVTDLLVELNHHNQQVMANFLATRA